MKTPYSQLFSEELPIAEAIIFEPLLPRYKKLKFLEWTIFFVLLIGSSVTAYILLPKTQSWMLYAFLSFCALWMLWAFINVHFGFPHKGFAIREQDLHYRTGWLHRSITSVPICRIQHMQVQQSMLGKIWKLAKLNIYTAGDSSHDMTIRGISFEKAQSIKTLISETINENG